MNHGRLSNNCAIENCYFAEVGDQHGPEECVTVAQVEELVIQFSDVPCAGCGLALKQHLDGRRGHAFFAKWGEQDETWAAGLN